MFHICIPFYSYLLFMTGEHKTEVSKTIKVIKLITLSRSMHLLLSISTNWLQIIIKTFNAMWTISRPQNHPGHIHGSFYFLQELLNFPLLFTKRSMLDEFELRSSDVCNLTIYGQFIF